MALTQVSRGLLSTSIVDNGNATAITIDSSENVLVGTDQTPATLITTSTTSHEGVGIADGYLAIARNLTGSAGSGGVAFLNRLATDGPILDLRKDGTTVGSIQSRAGVVSTIILDPRTNGAGLTGSTNGLIPVNQAGSTADNHVDLGSSSSRFKDLYLSGGAYLGGTAAANKLDDYEEGTFTVTIADAASGGNTGSGDLVGTYTKIGNTVNITLRVVNINTTGMTASNDFYIRGLPFPAIGTDSFGIGPVMCDRINFTNYVIAQVVPSQSYLVFKNITDSGSDDEVKVSDITASGASDILASVQYFTNL